MGDFIIPGWGSDDEFLVPQPQPCGGWLEPPCESPQPPPALTEPLSCALTLPPLEVDQALAIVGAAAAIYATAWGLRAIVRYLGIR